LPRVDEVEGIVEDHGDVVRQIERADSYVEFIDERPEKCPDRGYFLILHATESGRQKIEEIIASKFFFGVPYRFANV
jgi:putative heme iron utilization protein